MLSATQQPGDEPMTMLQHQIHVVPTALAHIGSVTLSMATRTSLTGGGDRRDGRNIPMIGSRN